MAHMSTLPSHGSSHREIYDIQKLDYSDWCCAFSHVFTRVGWFHFQWRDITGISVIVVSAYWWKLQSLTSQLKNLYKEKCGT